MLKSKILPRELYVLNCGSDAARGNKKHFVLSYRVLFFIDLHSLYANSR